MKYFFILIMFFSVLSCQQKEGQYNTNLKMTNEFMDSVSFMLAYEMGTNMMKDSLKINLDFYLMGMAKAFNGDSSIFDEPTTMKIRSSFQQFITQKQQIRMEKEKKALEIQGIENKAKSEKFLEDNKKNPKVMTTPTGLQYEVLAEGKGNFPTDDEFVTFHIVGKYMDGKEFDNSYTRKQPVSLKRGEQVPGWKEAFGLMKVGSKFRLFLPPALGWGEQGAPPTIPPNAVLIFEIELLNIDNKPPQTQEPVKLKNVN